MILHCAQCRTRFTADDAHKGKTFRCRVCASPIKTDKVDVMPADVGARAAFAATMVAEPPPVAAVMPRKDARAKRDLFAGEVELAAKVVEQDVAIYTAARNENSVLFSVAQFTKPQAQTQTTVARAFPTATPAAPASPSTAPTDAKDESGMIDLNKMMTERLSAKSVRPQPISEAPLGYVREVAHTPLPMVSDALQNPFGKKRTGVIAALAAAAVVAIVSIGIVATDHADARVKAAAAAAAAAAQPPPVAVMSEPPPAAPLTVAKTPDTTSDDKPEAKTTARSSGKARKASGSGSRSASASAPAAPAAPKKASDPCGCHGNLLCNMKCTAR